MEEAIIHRRARKGHGLCGADGDGHTTSLDDSKVTCPECLALLRQVTDSSVDIRVDFIDELLKERFEMESVED